MTGDEPTLAPSDAGATLPSVPSGAVATPAVLTASPGRYAIEHELARGGMGRVLAARDLGLGRRVAVKQLLGDDPEIAARFSREAAITARLQHPAIVPVYEAGHTDGGSPFYAMRLVSGRTLDQVFAETATLAGRLALLPNLIAVADAIAYAHSERVLHRDLKPSNVLVGRFGETVVIDWGLAKLRDGDDDPRLAGAPASGDGGAERTQAGAVMGTPAYMPPEQALGELVDERADVYALGVMLYELLAGTKPYRGGTSAAVLAQVLEGPPTSLARLAPQAPRELVDIAAKAMARRREDRYPTAAELVDDLRRFQTGQIVSAHRYSRWARVRRFVARHRAAVAAIAGVAIAMAVASSLFVQRILAERARAVAARGVAEARSQALVLERARAALGTDPTAALAWLKLRPSDGAARVVAADAESRGVVRRHLRMDETANALALAPDGRTLVVTGLDHGLWLWDLGSGRSRVLRYAHGFGEVALSPDGKRAFALEGMTPAVIWSLADGSARELADSPDSDGAARAWWSADGHNVVGAGERGGVRAWDADVPGPPRVLAAPSATAGEAPVALSPDGTVVALAEVGGKVVHLVALATGARRSLPAQPTTVTCVAFSPDGRQLAVGGTDATVRVWDLAAGRARVLQALTLGIGQLTFFPDGKHLAGAGVAHALMFWDLGSDEVADGATERGTPTGFVTGLAADVLAVTTDARTVELWRSDGTRLVTLQLPEVVDDAAVLPGGRLAVASGAGVAIFDDPLGRVAQCAVDGRFNRAAVSSDGRHAAAASKDGLLVRWDLRSSRCTASERVGQIHPLVATPDGAAFVSGSTDGSLRWWPSDGGPGRVLAQLDTAVDDLALLDDGRAILAGTHGGDLVRVEVAGGGPRVVAHQAGGVLSLSLFPNGRRVATAATDGHLLIFELPSGRVLADTVGADRRVLVSPVGDALVYTTDPAPGHPALVVLTDGDGRTLRELYRTSMDIFGLAWSASGDRVAVTCGNRAYLFRAADGRQLDALVRTGEVVQARFLDGDRVLATLDSVEDLVMQDLATGERRAHAYDGFGVEVAFAGDGAVAFLPTYDTGTLHAWRTTIPGDPSALPAWLGTATDEAIDASSLH